MVVRRNNSIKPFIENADYIYRVGISIPLLNPNNKGFPTKEETSAINQIEDELNNLLEKNDDTIEALVITTDGIREFVYHTRKPQVVEQVINNVRGKFPSHQIQFYVEEDNEWFVYKEFSQKS
jgi:hypothetical protein